MTTSNEHDDGYDELRAELVRSSAALVRQRMAVARAEDENKDLIKRALKAGHAEGVVGFRSDVQKIAPFSVPTVRGLADEAGIPPDERYVKAAQVRRAREGAAPASIESPTRKAEPAGLGQPVPPSAEELPNRFRKLPAPLAAKIVDRLRRECPTWYEENRALVPDVPPQFQNAMEIKRAADAGILDDLGIVLP